MSDLPTKSWLGDKMILKSFHQNDVNRQKIDNQAKNCKYDLIYKDISWLNVIQL